MMDSMTFVEDGFSVRLYRERDGVNGFDDFGVSVVKPVHLPVCDIAKDALALSMVSDALRVLRVQYLSQGLFPSRHMKLPGQGLASMKDVRVRAHGHRSVGCDFTLLMQPVEKVERELTLEYALSGVRAGSVLVLDRWKWLDEYCVVMPLQEGARLHVTPYGMGKVDLRLVRLIAMRYAHLQGLEHDYTGRGPIFTKPGNAAATMTYEVYP